MACYLTLTKGGAASTEGMTKEDRAKAEAKVAGIKAAYAEAATLNNAGKYDEAIAKFNEVLASVPKCTECYIGIGTSAASKKDYAASEAAYKKALEIDPNSADAYNGLATIYNDQKKFDHEYNEWLEERRENDRNAIAKHEGKMQEIMAKYNIPRDVPYEEIASGGRGY